MLRVAQHGVSWRMIKSFQYKGLQKFFVTGNLKGIKQQLKQKRRIRLTALDTATCIEDMDLPGSACTS